MSGRLGRGGRRGGRVSVTPLEHGQRSGGRNSGGGRGGAGGRSGVDPSVPNHPSVQPVSSSSLSEEVRRRLTIDERAKEEPLVAEAAPAAPPTASRQQPRPGFGTAGKKCWVRANHFLVEIKDNDLFHYDVSMTPESTSRVTNRKVVSELVSLHRDDILGMRTPAYDGRKSLYTAGALPFDVKDFIVSLPESGQRRAKEFRVTIRYAGRTSIHNLKEFLRGKQIDGAQEVIQVLDVVLRESATSKYVAVGRSFFSPAFGHRVDIGNGLECWRGYYQSLRPTQMGLSLNIDISATSFYKPVNVVEFVAEYLNLRDVSRPLSAQQCAKIKRAFRGVQVETTHRKEATIRYRITGITAEPLQQLKFPVEEANTLKSVVQYFKERYNYDLKHVSWPCLQAGSESKKTYLPMEVCKIVEGQRYSKRLTEKQVTEILRATCQRPQDREKSIVEMVHLNDYNNDDFARVFGIGMKYELTSVEARVLPAPTLKYHDSGNEKSCNPSVGQWNMVNKKVVNGCSVDYWTCLSFVSFPRKDEVIRFCSELIGMCHKLGMVINPRPFVDIQSAHPDRMESALKEVNSKSIETLIQKGVEGKHIQLLIVILPEITGFYGRLKRICETELAIVSQCCMPKHVSRFNNKYLENVALKINVKGGGRNTVLEDALYRRIPLLTDLPTIIFGADVTHPPAGEDSTPSIAAVVASTDWPEVSMYRGLISAQNHREELIQDLFTVVQDQKKGTIACGGMIRSTAVVLSINQTKATQNRIIFYRDGVSEGQFSHVLLYEMDAIRKACASLQEGYLPPVTFVVVQKRHHTRLFPEVHGSSNRGTDKSGNILPGTVVDKKICHPTEFDFYLCSHSGIQGTSRPTHYHVLLDENSFSADGLQMLTYNLCYTYARCTRSVSVVPPAYYAHLAAYRARYYLESESSETGGSSIGRAARGGRPDVKFQRLPQVKDRVKEVMFYC